MSDGCPQRLFKGSKHLAYPDALGPGRPDYDVPAAVATMPRPLSALFDLCAAEGIIENDQEVQAMRASLLASAIASTLWCNIGGFDPG